MGLDKKKIVTFLARVAPSNGVIELVEAFFKILQKRNDVVLLIIGMPEIDNYYSLSVRNKVKEYSKSGIYLLPFRNDIPTILKSSYIHICPFIQPHFSRGIIEASAVGIPSIGTNVGGVNELINNGETGFLYSSYKEFELLLYELLDNQDIYSKFSISCKNLARNKFSSTNNTQEVFEIYKKLLFR